MVTIYGPQADSDMTKGVSLIHASHSAEIAYSVRTSINTHGSLLIKTAFTAHIYTPLLLEPLGSNYTESLRLIFNINYLLTADRGLGSPGSTPRGELTGVLFTYLDWEPSILYHQRGFRHADVLDLENLCIEGMKQAGMEDEGEVGTIVDSQGPIESQ
ncbi:hypothetical protein Tco_0199863 [Tanacetum coccineum]